MCAYMIHASECKRQPVYFFMATPQDNQICTLKGSLTMFTFLEFLDISNNQVGAGCAVAISNSAGDTIHPYLCGASRGRVRTSLQSSTDVCSVA